jgi:hypothetical protein
MLWKTIGRWALVVVAVPLAAAGLRKVGESMERSKGQTRFTSILRTTASGLDSVSGRGRPTNAVSR